MIQMACVSNIENITISYFTLQYCFVQAVFVNKLIFQRGYFEKMVNVSLYHPSHRLNLSSIAAFSGFWFRKE